MESSDMLPMGRLLAGAEGSKAVVVGGAGKVVGVKLVDGKGW